MTPARLADADLVLFDLDGTLVASGPGILSSVRHALAELGEPIPAPEVLSRFIGPPLLDSFQHTCGMPPTQAWAAVQAYREHYAAHGQFDASVYDGIPSVLATLAAQGRTLAVATSKAQPYAESVLGHFGLAGWFPTVVGSELDGTRTAKAEVIDTVLRRVAQPVGGAVMVGDRRHDVLGARQVGIPCLGALWGYGSARELSAAGAAALVESPLGLLEILTPHGAGSTAS